MPELRNPRWEKFAQAYLLSGNASEAFRRAGYRADPYQNANKLTSNPCIKQRMIELRAEALFNVQLTREKIAGFYGRAMVTPVGELTPDHPLAQSYEVTEKGIKVRGVDKVASAQALSRMMGYDAPQQVEVTVNPLTSYLRTLRGGQDVQVIEDKATTQGDSP